MLPAKCLRNIGLTVLAVSLFIIGAAAEAALSLPDVGMVTILTGEVSYTDGQGQKGEAKAFMKIRANDRFALAAGSSLQLVFFGDGRKETWKGPLSVQIGDKGAAAEGSGASDGAEVQTMSEPVANEVRRVAALIDSSRLQRSGAVLVRGDSKDQHELIETMPLNSKENQVIEKARARFQDLLKETAPQDITAELYFFSVLADYDQFSEMKELIGAMRRKQPDNSQIDLLSEWLNEQIL